MRELDPAFDRGVDEDLDDLLAWQLLEMDLDSPPTRRKLEIEEEDEL